MNRKVVLKILILSIFLLLIVLLNYKNNIEDFTNIGRTNTTEDEYIEPILRILYSDEIKYIDSRESSDLILTQNAIPSIKKPYILMNGEPNLRQFEMRITNPNYNNNKENWIGSTESQLYFTALTDPYCVGCIVTTLDFVDTSKTFYVPLVLDRGHDSFTKSPFVRQFTNSERPFLAAYVAKHSPVHRDEFFKELRALDETVDGLGDANHTKDLKIPPRSSWWELPQIYKDYKFGFALENINEKGYISEKIMNVYLGGAIPLYWGTSVVKEIFNPESFVYLNDFPDLKAAAKYVYELSKDESRLKAMREAPIFVKDSPYEQYYNVPPPQWVVDIANKIKQNMEKIKLLT